MLPMKLHTIGYGGRKPSEFLELLAARGVKTAIDVRLRPDRASLGTFARSRDPLKGIQGFLAAAGIQYAAFGELGNLFIDCEDWKVRYPRLIQEAGDILLERFLDVLRGERLPGSWCLLCAERRPEDCHRQFIAARLVELGYSVDHIL